MLVTGHTGFKGSWLTVWLHELGAELGGYALAPEGEPNLFDRLGLASRCRHRIADVRDAGALRETCAAFDPEIVIHMAAQSLVRRSYRDPVGTFTVNAMGTAHLLDACRGRANLRAVVVVTTDKVYENPERGDAFAESDPLGGHDPYSASKAAAEIVTASYRRSFGPGSAAGDLTAAVASARAGNVFGGGDWSKDRLIPDAARAFGGGGSVLVRNPSSIRPWQHVVEPLSGYLMLARALWERPEPFARAYNFGPRPDQVLEVGAVMDAFARHWGDGARWHHEPQKTAPHEAATLLLDSAAARGDLGWAPAAGFEEAVAGTALWYKQACRGASAADLHALTVAQIEAFSGVPVRGSAD